jgi:tryptophan-rich sensory protein
MLKLNTSIQISIWGGPIRLQAKLHPPRPRNSLNTFLARPWRVIHWMKNPEAFINMMATPEVEMVEMKPEIFPITWISLRLLLMYAVAKVRAFTVFMDFLSCELFFILTSLIIQKVASTEPNKCNWCIKERNIIRKLMNSYFVQLALCDEWYRVFVIEKRVGLGITVISGALIGKLLIHMNSLVSPTLIQFLSDYFCTGIYFDSAMISLLCFCAKINPTATLLLIPSSIALVTSSVMNVLIYLDQVNTKRGKIKR